MEKPSMRRCRPVLAAAGLLLLTASASAGEIGIKSPTQRTRALIKACKNHPEVKPQAKMKVSFHDFCNFHFMTEEAVRPHIGKFSKEQLKRYKSVFEELIQLVAFPNSGRAFQEGNVDVKKAKITEDRATVPMFFDVDDDDIQLDVVFHWARAPGKKWRLVDVEFDGASLTKDYQNQFGRIIAKHGVDNLLDKLERRLEKERAKKK